MGSTILALGHYAPERRVTNAEIETRLALEAGWILRRTGIAERRFAAEGEALSDHGRQSRRDGPREGGL